MNFKSDKQRKFLFAKLNKFANSPIIGYTGSKIYTSPSGSVEPLVYIDGSAKEIGNTAILAGEDYKRGILNKLAAEKGLDYQHINLADDENRELVRNIAAAERFRPGYPVYSVEPMQRELIPGGYGAGCPDSEFDPEQLRKGIEIEKEHAIKWTDKGNIRKFNEKDLERAKEITKDHLVGDHPKYYDYLEEAEKKMENDLITNTGEPYPDIGNKKHLDDYSSAFSDKIYPEQIKDISSDLSYMQDTENAAKNEQTQKQGYYPFAEVDVNDVLRKKEPVLGRHRNIPIETKSFEKKQHFYNARPDQGLNLSGYAEESI